jgi:tetratricopeptide (TPR) repeat protein
MAGFFNKNKHRTVLPRWRLFDITTKLGELSSVRDNIPAKHDVSSLAGLVSDFEQHQSVWHAADLLSTAFAIGQNNVAHGAAKFILAHSDDVAPPAVELANRVLFGLETNDSPAPGWDVLVRDDRRHLIEYNWDATRWCDLGLAHTVLGNKTNAVRSLVIATQLAPTNRFIVRSAVRCFMHWNEPDRAQSVLRVALQQTNDPWLAAADIAASLALHRRPQNVVAAKLIVADRSIHVHHISELATAIGSLELESGSTRKAKQFFGLGLEDPTENSVAQIEWMLAERNIDAPSIEHVDHVPRLYEAKARDRYADGDWEQALKYAEKWYEDQPFSSRPADMASYTAGLLQRYRVAAVFLKRALRANPGKPMMLNNLAYFQAMDNQLEAALQTFSMMEGLELGDEDRLVTQATRGLLSMRTGDVALGRNLYRATIDQARMKKKSDVRILAMLNFAREEHRIGNTDEAVSLLNIARSEARKHDDKEIQTTLRVTELAIERQPEPVA